MYWKLQLFWKVLIIMIVSFSSWPEEFFVTSFNFDVENPIVIQNSYDHPASHFGYALTLITGTTMNETGRPSRIDSAGWIIIGSPKANSNHPNYTRIKEPGMLWKCSIGSAISCRPILLDPLGELDLRVRDVPINMVHRDRKEGSMLGASIADKGSNLITCASRWMNQKYTGYHLMNGLCYWINAADITKEESESTANSSTWCEPESTVRLLPLVDKSRLAYTIPGADPPEKRFDWAFGQTGFSTHFTDNNELLLGAPGVLEWTGTVIRYRNVTRQYGRGWLPPPKQQLPPSQSGTRTRQQKPTSQQQRQYQPFNQVIVIRAQTTKKVLQYFDYFGYAVTSGRFFKDTVTTPGVGGSSMGEEQVQVQYASGAPRAASLSGLVLVFTINEQQESLNLLVEPIDGGYNGFGSYFGSVLATGDMNGDGYDELLIGAPLYGSSSSSSGGTSREAGGGTEDVGTTPDTEYQSDGPSKGSSRGTSGEMADEGILNRATGDEGCVFVYFSNGDHFTAKPQEICGSHHAGARFGSAISVLGDINDDTIQDVAIGAPYENEGRGAVYIYHGSRTFLSLAQKLNPMQINRNIKGFGLSLSAGVDIDANKLPDLAVGAYDSNHVLIFRTLPVVNITGNLSTTVGKLHSNTGTFVITSCLSYSGKTSPSSMRIWLKLTADIEIRKVRIVEFVNGGNSGAEESPDGSETFKNYLTRLKVYQREGTCYDFQATTVGDLDLVTLPVTIRQEFWTETNVASQQNDQIPAKSRTKPIYIDITRRKSTTRNSTSKIKAGKTAAASSVISDDSISDLLVTSRPGNPAFNDFANKLPQSMFGESVIGSSLLSIPIAAICEEDGIPDCLAELKITATLENGDGDQYSDTEPFIIGSYKSVLLKIQLENLHETANLPLTVDIQWIGPPMFKTSRSLSSGAGECVRKSAIGGVGIGGIRIEQLYTCSFKKPLTRNKKEFVDIELDTTELFSEGIQSSLQFQLNANTSSALTEPAEITVEFPTIGKTELTFHGQGSEVPYYDNMTAETVNFTHIYEVGALGPSPVYSVVMDFYVPETVLIDGTEMELLRIREPTSMYDGNRLRCTSVNAPFYLETTTASSEYEDDFYIISTAAQQSSLDQGIRNRRRRRELPSSSVSVTSPNKDILRTQLTLSCASILSATKDDALHSGNLNGNFEISKCLHVQCEANHFHPGATALVEFKLRLVTSTAKILFLDEEREIVVIQSFGRVNMINSTGVKFGHGVLSSPKGFIRIQRPSEIEAWILIVAVGGGLILLTLLTVILTRCGFFRRTKREELDALRAQHEVNEHFGFDLLSAYDDEDYDCGPVDEYDFSTMQMYHPHYSTAVAASDIDITGYPTEYGHIDGADGIPEEEYAEIYDHRIFDQRGNEAKTYC